MRPAAFGLRSLLLWTAFAGILLALGNYLGRVPFFAAVGVSLIVAFIWYLGFRRAPRPTIYASILVLLFAPLSAVAVVSILNTRESARRHQSVENLRKMGLDRLRDVDSRHERDTPTGH